MNTIRGRLVAALTATLSLALLAFAAVLYMAEQPERFRELDARLHLQADLIASLFEAEAALRDSLQRAAGGGQEPVPVASVRSLVEAAPDYVTVVGPSQELLYISRAARDLPSEPLLGLVELGKHPTTGTTLGSTDLAQRAGFIPVRYCLRPVRVGRGLVGSIVVAAPRARAVPTSARLLPAMVFSIPLIIGVAALIVYLIVDRTVQPVDAIVEEVEAITDGRSLHRRLMESQAQDELGRLTHTLNAMLSRLEGSFASLRRFTADASHELKTPLTVLRSGIERAITHPKAPPEVMEVLEETLVEVNRMAELVDALLTLARADEGRAPLHLEQVPLQEVLGEVSETASILGEQGGVAVSVHVPDQPITMAMDRSRIRQMLMNLLTNAIKYTPQGGEVAIDCSRADADVTLSVRDTGVGIAPGDLPHIFDRFWRADQARSRTGSRPGVGLGLAISKWIAEAHGGTITAQSRPGRGTTFTVTLPIGGV
jgi:two-component system OmpR family sensor kinase